MARREWLKRLAVKGYKKNFEWSEFSDRKQTKPKLGT